VPGTAPTGFTAPPNWFSVNYEDDMLAAAAAAVDAQAELPQIPEEPVIATTATGAQPRVLFDTPGMVSIEAAARATMISEIVTQCTQANTAIIHNMLDQMADQQAIDASTLREQNARAQARYEYHSRQSHCAMKSRASSQRRYQGWYHKHRWMIHAAQFKVCSTKTLD
jgi:hypothetical protein